jgi:Uma2 family endonuclease
MWDSGVLEGKWVILVDGELLDMPAPDLVHDAAVELVNAWLRTVFPVGYWVRVQMGMILGVNTDPVPDVALVPGGPRTLVQHPHAAELVVEVANSSLPYDTGEKASLYAAAGIADYWVIDVINRRLHVFRGPQPNSNQKYGHGYAQAAVLTPADTVAPLAAPNSPVTVGDLLP